jgi:threonine/homoserine/homoserine lactone efflux protein
MVILFLVFGYTGEKIIRKEYLIYISIIGSLYICYVAIKIMKSKTNINGNNEVKLFSFKEGLLMQIMNPKGILATLPVATIHFPANDINGVGILIASILLATLAGFAPTTYSFIGEHFGSLIKKDKILKGFNIVMGLLLIYVAFTIFKDHVYLVLAGINEY